MHVEHILFKNSCNSRIKNAGQRFHLDRLRSRLKSKIIDSSYKIFYLKKKQSSNSQLCTVHTHVLHAQWKTFLINCMFQFRIRIQKSRSFEGRHY